MANVSAFSGAMPITPGGLVELGYSEFATTQQSLSTTQQSVTNGPITVVCDGSPVLIEISGMASIPQGNQINISLYRDGSYINQYWLYRYNGYPTAVGDYPNLTRWYRDTPSAGTHTYEVRAFASNTSGTVTINANPSFQTRISKIVQQNDGLKPFWTPPLVTQLPSNPTVGDTVIYAADATNGVYWNLYYDGIGTYPWKYVGGPPLYDAGGGYQAITSTSYVDLTGVTINTTLAGDYDVRLDAQLQQPNTNGWVTYLSVSHAGGTLGDYTYPIVYAPSTGGTDNGASRMARILSLAANNTLQGRARVNAGTGYVGYCRLTATPVRVAA